MQRGSNQAMTFRTFDIGVNVFFFHHPLYLLPEPRKWSLPKTVGAPLVKQS
jgi:hypothetical protein